MFSVGGMLQFCGSVIQEVLSVSVAANSSQGVENHVAVERAALTRFGQKVVDSVNAIADGIVREIPSGRLGENKLSVVREKVKEVFFRLMNAGTDRLERILPDINQEGGVAVAFQKRRDFGIRMAGCFHRFANSCEQVSDQVRSEKKLTMSSGAAFIEAFNENLRLSEDLGRYADQNVFYTRLKDELYRSLRSEDMFDEIISSELQYLITEYIFPEDTIKEHIGSLLALAERETVNPFVLKILTSKILDVCSKAIESHFDQYLQQLESPKKEEVPSDFNSIYGQTIMSLLRVLDPKLGVFHLVKFLEWYLVREKMLAGTDELTQLVAALTQGVIEKAMGSNVDVWTGNIVTIIRKNLFDEHHNYIEKPFFINSVEWERLRRDKESRLQLDTPNSPLLRRLKGRYEREGQAKFQKSCIRIATAVSVASFVYEQHLLTERQIVTAKKNLSKFRRFTASVTSKILALTVVRVVVELFFRCLIWLRVGVAKLVGYAAGVSLAHRASLFLQTEAPSLLFRKILIAALRDLSFLNPEEYVGDDQEDLSILNPAARGRSYFPE